MSGLSTKVQLNVAATLVSSLDLADATFPMNKTYLTALVAGAGAGQADRLFADTRVLTASSNEDLDLAGALLDPLGGAFSLARVKGLIVRAADANVNNVVVGAAASNAWAALLNATGTVTLRPGAMFAAFVNNLATPDAVGYVVTPGTGDLLRVTNGGAGTSVSYDIIVIGCSA